MRKPFAILLAAALVSLPSRSRAQITTMEEYHGRTIGCSVSGLRGAYTFCGIDSNFQYHSVFVGTIINVTPIEKESEFRLVLEPQEVFFGSPGSTITVMTRGGECIDHDAELRAGDRWLFFLQADEKTSQPILWFGAPSGPVDKVPNQLSLLRLQKDNPEKGLITGNVARAKDEFSGKPLAGHPVKIKRKSDGTEQTTNSDATGYFRFPPLAPGEYAFTGNTIPGLWAEPVTVDVHPLSCALVPVDLSPDAAITGHVFDLDGKPIQYARIEVTPFHGPLGAGDAITQADGSYEIHGLRAGTYYLGIGVSYPESATFTFYYPGSATKQSAIPITLRKNERRDHLDIRLTRPYDPTA